MAMHLEAGKSTGEETWGDTEEEVELMANERRDSTTRVRWMDEAREADVQRELTDGVEMVEP